MEFRINTEALLKSLTAISKAVPVKPAFPILQNFLFQLKGERLRITASDGEMTVRTIVPVMEQKKEGETCIPAQVLLNLLKTLPLGEINFKVVGNSVKCDWETGNSMLPVFDTADYSCISNPDKESPKVSFNQKELQSALSRTLFATSDDEARPTLMGLLFDIDPEGTNIVGTDSRVLVCYNDKNVTLPEKKSFILPKKAGSLMKGLLKNEGTVTVQFNSNYARFVIGNVEILCRLITGRYPNYKAVIPENNRNIMFIERDNLLGVLKRMSVCADKVSSVIKAELAFNELKLSSQDPGFSVAATEKIVCDYDGTDISIGFKAPFFIDALEKITSEKVQLKFESSVRAFLLEPTEEKKTEEPFKAVLMPVAFQ